MEKAKVTSRFFMFPVSGVVETFSEAYEDIKDACENKYDALFGQLPEDVLLDGEVKKNKKGEWEKV